MHIYHNIEISIPKSHDIEIPRPKKHDIEKRRQLTNGIAIPRHFSEDKKPRHRDSKAEKPQHRDSKTKKPRYWVSVEFWLLCSLICRIQAWQHRWKSNCHAFRYFGCRACRHGKSKNYSLKNFNKEIKANWYQLQWCFRSMLKTWSVQTKNSKKNAMNMNNTVDLYV